MRKFKFLFILLIGILLIPTGVFAADKNEPVNVYFFHGDGCPHCAEAEEFFDSIEDKYGDEFNLVSYEVWYDEDNAELMSQVADIRKEDGDGVPYIVIGNQSWDGYMSSYDNEIIEKIESEYKTDPDERYDVMDYVDAVYKNSGNQDAEESIAGDIAAVIAIVLVVAGVGFGIWFARKKAA